MAAVEENPLLKSYGKDFFKKLDESVDIQVPEMIQNILSLNDINCARVLSRLTEDDLGRIEVFMKEYFTATMIRDNQPIEKYLGVFSLSQQKFHFLPGQKIIIRMIVEHCATLMRINPASTTTIPSTSPSQQEERRNQERHETRSPEDQVELKKKLIRLLFQSLFSWIKSQPSLTEVFFLKVIFNHSSDKQIL